MSQVAFIVDASFGCWNWTGKLSNDGYPIIWRGKRPIGAHRVVYERNRGLIAPDLALDHLCRNRLCVAPHHLEPVDKHENELRKLWRYRSKRKLCPAGHDLQLLGIVTPNGGKVCRECNRRSGERAC